MRILFIGDIVGKPGRKILSNNLPMLKKLHNIDFVVANGENSAGGNGITKNMAEELSRCGIDAITLGDHIWDQRCLISEIESIENICRPANLPPENPGRDFVIVERDGKKLGVFCLLGQTLMKIKADCPFRAAAEMSAKLSEMCDAVLLDFLPFFGTGTALIPWAVLKILSADYQFAVGLIIIYLVSQLVRQLIQPKIVGDTIGLNPLVTLFCMFIGYKVGGILAMIIAVPIGMILISLYESGAFDDLIADVKNLAEGLNNYRKDK